MKNKRFSFLAMCMAVAGMLGLGLSSYQKSSSSDTIPPIKTSWKFGLPMMLDFSIAL